jgi:hypothetical protein
VDILEINIGLSNKAKETLESKKLWRTLRVRHSFLDSGFYFALLLITKINQAIYLNHGNN